MKKLLYGTLVLALVGIAFTFTSCEKSDIVNNIIHLHNDALSYSFNNIKNNPNLYKRIDKPTDKMLDEIILFMKSNIKSRELDNNCIDAFYNDYKCFDEKTHLVNHFNRIKNNDYYKKLMFLTDKGYDSRKFTIEANQLKDRIIRDKTLSQTDKTILTSGILIGIESYEYWDLNNAYWLRVGEQHFKPKSIKKDKGAIARADIQDAIGGAITGVCTGGVFGALAGATLGAAWGSAIEGASQHFGWGGPSGCVN